MVRRVGNELGNKLLEAHLSKAFAENLHVRMVVATARDHEAVEREPDASKIEKTFHVLENQVGQITAFDGNHFVVEFRRPQSPMETT